MASRAFYWLALVVTCRSGDRQWHTTFGCMYLACGTQQGQFTGLTCSHESYQGLHRLAIHRRIVLSKLNRL
eukprot:scaffold388524_cov37-Prasinocladus_malaysianus.AAC.1